MKLLLLGIVVELIGVNFGLIGVVLGGSIYRDITRCAAVLGFVLAVIGIFSRSNKE